MTGVSTIRSQNAPPCTGAAVRPIYGIPVLVARRLLFLNGFESRIDVRERPAGELVVAADRALGGHRHSTARFAVKSFAPVVREQPVQLCEPRLAMTPPHRLETIDHRDGGDGECRSGIQRGRDQHVSAAVGYAPDAGAFVVHSGKRLGKAERVAVVLDLVPGIDVLSRLAGTLPEPTVVEPQSGASEVFEILAVPGHDNFFGVAPSARHDHERHVAGFPGGPRQYALAGVPAAVELDVLRHGVSSRYQFLNGRGEDTHTSGSGVLSQRPPPRLPRPAALPRLAVESSRGHPDPFSS